MRILARRYGRVLEMVMRKHFVRNLRRRGLFPDANEEHRHRASARRYQWPAAPHSSGRSQLASHISRAAASQLSALFLGPARLAHWHVDATDGDELVRISNPQFEVA